MGVSNDTKAEDHCEALDSTLSMGQDKSDHAGGSHQRNTIEQASDENLTRYENLARAAKTFIFTVIVKDGHAVCTIHYPGVVQITGYAEEEYAAQPQGGLEVPLFRVQQIHSGGCHEGPCYIEHACGE